MSQQDSASQSEDESDDVKDQIFNAWNAKFTDQLYRQPDLRQLDGQIQVYFAANYHTDAAVSRSRTPDFQARDHIWLCCTKAQPHQPPKFEFRNSHNEKVDAVRALDPGYQIHHRYFHKMALQKPHEEAILGLYNLWDTYVAWVRSSDSVGGDPFANVAEDVYVGGDPFRNVAQDIYVTGEKLATAGEYSVSRRGGARPAVMDQHEGCVPGGKYLRLL